MDVPTPINTKTAIEIFARVHPEMYEWLVENQHDWELVHFAEDASWADFWYAPCSYFAASVCHFKKEEAALFIMFWG